MCTNVDAAGWCTFTLSLDVDSIDSSCHPQLVLCCNNDREKHFFCGEGTFELAPERSSSFTFVILYILHVKCMARYSNTHVSIKLPN